MDIGTLVKVKDIDYFCSRFSTKATELGLINFESEYRYSGDKNAVFELVSIKDKYCGLRNIKTGREYIYSHYNFSELTEVKHNYIWI